MKYSSKYSDLVKYLVGKGYLDLALNNMIVYTKYRKEQYHNDFIELNARLNQVERDWLKGIIGYQIYAAERRKIANSILALVDKVFETNQDHFAILK